MKRTRLLFCVLLATLFAAAAFAQTDTFSDANVDYTFKLPDAAWKQIVKPSATSPNVEYVYNDRSDARLEVRGLTVKTGGTLDDAIGGEEQKVQFLPGYVAGKTEKFGGSLDGKVFNYEFIRAGRNMSGRFYFLKADDKTIYVLRFTGQREKLKTIRNQTDSIARTFAVKKK